MAAIRRAHGGLKDDTSVIVLDLLPPERTWPAIASPPAPRKAAACFCFAPCAPGRRTEGNALPSALFPCASPVQESSCTARELKRLPQ